MFQITAKTDYGLLFMVALANQEERRPVSLRLLAEQRHLPYAFLTQITMPLRQAGLVEAKEGVNGGYQLTRSPRAISVGDIIHALEGDLRLVRCLRHEDNDCPSIAMCELSPFWTQVGERLTTSLNAMTLADLAADPSVLTPTAA